MEYVFGTEGEIEVLKTKGDSHTELTGYPGEKIADNFRVVRKIDSTEDSEGNCYDWYEIDRHFQQIDRTGPVAEAGAKNTANIDYLSMMSGIDLPGEDEE